MKKFCGLRKAVFLCLMLFLIILNTGIVIAEEDPASTSVLTEKVTAGENGTTADTKVTIPVTECEHQYVYTHVKARPGKDDYYIGICSECGDKTVKEGNIAAPETLTLKSDDFTYTGKKINTGLVIRDSKGKKISSSEYTVSYTVKNASVTPKNVGKYKLTVTFKGNKYSGVMIAGFRILPGKVSFTEATGKNNEINVSWNSLTSQCTGYQLDTSSSSSFKSGTTTRISLKGRSKSGKCIKGYPADTTVYVRIRSYKTVSGKNYYSAWSSAKKLKVTQGSISLSAKAAVIMNADTGKVYFGKDMNKRLANASTTKLMTVLLALKNKSLNSKIKITSTAANTPYSKLGSAAAGDSAYLKDLLYMALLPSDNGVANALAISVSGSISSFVSEMNKEARKLGLKNTHYENAHGLDTQGHYSSAKDLAKLARECMTYTAFRKTVSTRSYTFKTLNYKHSYTVSTTNQLLGTVSGVVGGKTGTTTNAGKCFVCFFDYNGEEYITVVLGAPSEETRWSNTRSLLSYIRNHLG